MLLAVPMAQAQAPVTLHLATDSAAPLIFDPARATDADSRRAVANLFLGLTAQDPITNEIVPALAHTWEVSPDGLTWTFHLRDDVSWYLYAGGQAIRSRAVTAQDAARAIEQLCRRVPTHPAVPLIAGCGEGTPAVVAPDAVTLQVRLTRPAAYFLAMSTLIHPIAIAMDDAGPGNILTNGPYFLESYAVGGAQTYVRNPHLPADLMGPGNIERVVIETVVDPWTAYGMFDGGQLDVAPLPDGATAPDEAVVVQVADPMRYYVGFNYNAPPFDSVHARRAFSAAIDEEGFVEQGGVGYDPRYAREQLALAGYPGCEGLPTVRVAVPPDLSNWARSWVAAIGRELGCASSAVEIETLEWEQIEPLRSADAAGPPQAWVGGWQGDYPDLHHWYSGVLHCTVAARPCGGVDELLLQAAVTFDGDRRRELYRRAEETFFGPEGEFPITPLLVRRWPLMVKPGLIGPFETEAGGVPMRWNAYTLARWMG